MFKSISFFLTIIVFLFSSQVQAQCEMEFISSCDSTVAAIDYYGSLVEELESMQNNCKGDCKKLTNEMKSMSACLQEAITHHNTACSIGFNDEEIQDAPSATTSSRGLAMVGEQ